jgi:hypothetical protein
MSIVDDNAIDTSTSETSRRKWASWIRLPSFAFCSCTALLVCIVYAGWIIVDAQYPSTANTFLRYTVKDPSPHRIWESVRSWDYLGPRLLLFTILALTLIASSLLMILQFLRRTTIRRMLVTVLVLCAWLSLWASFGRLYEWGAMRRMRSALPRFELAADVLSQHWPTEDGSLPEARAFHVAVRSPNVLWVPKPSRYPIREDFGQFISRSDKGAIRFRLLDSTHRQIEFHPEGSMPTSHTNPLFGTPMTIDEAIQLKDHWYFVRYGGPTTVNPFTRLPPFVVGRSP